MHIAASSPLALDKQDLDENILKKEKEIITEELKNSGKDTKIIDKIAMGKLNKFISDHTTKGGIVIVTSNVDLNLSKNYQINLSDYNV